MENFKIDVDADGIALITFDVPGRSMNTLTSSVMKEIPELVERIKTDDAIKGAVITSGKASGFCAGADLGDMAGGVLSGEHRSTVWISRRGASYISTSLSYGDPPEWWSPWKSSFLAGGRSLSS